MEIQNSRVEEKKTTAKLNNLIFCFTLINERLISLARRNSLIIFKKQKNNKEIGKKKRKLLENNEIT
jgi:hypothetical protein